MSYVRSIYVLYRLGNKSAKGHYVVSPCQVAESYRKRTLASVNFVNLAIQVSDEKLFTGHTRQQKINNRFDDGDIVTSASVIF